jgi:regulator of sigma D
MLSTDTHTTARVPERRNRSRDMIKAMVVARKDTLSLYARLGELRPNGSNTASVFDLLQRFCQALIDYTARAHFQLYQHIEEKTERRAEVLEVAERIYPRIAELTQVIVDFNDKYDCEPHADNLRQLATDLSELGAALKNRVELEDQLIKVLCRDCVI